MYLRRLQRVSLVLLPLLLLLAAAAGPASAQATGKIAGKVVNAKSGEPISYANVVILGTTMGAMSVDDGSFFIDVIPVGTYSVKVTMMGYESQTIEGVIVDANRTTTIEFRISEKVVGEVPEVVVHKKRPLIQKESSQTVHVVESKELTQLPVDSYQEAIALKSGVVAQSGQLHFRGGRSGEVLYKVDGVPVRDPLVGGGVGLGTLALAESEVIMGGMDAEYGNAQSGVVDIKTKEGGQEFQGDLRFLTDDYGAPDKTYDNYDRLSLGMGGPTPVKNLTYYLSVEGTFTDTYLKTSEQRPRHYFLDFIRLGNRQRNDFRLQTKLAYKATPDLKITAEYMKNESRYDNYVHKWSRDGYVQVLYDSLSDSYSYGRWSWRQEDSTFVHWNGPSHTPDYVNGFDQIKLVLSQTVSNGFYIVRLNRQNFKYSASVQGKKPWDYEIRYPEYWWGNFDEGRFYATHGDYPYYRERQSVVWGLDADWSMKYRGHNFKAGIEANYNNMRLLSLDFPNFINSSRNFGGFRSDYHYYNPEGSFYVQDRWEHEGMVINAGIRYDMFSVGDQVEASAVRDRIKDQWSPRLGIAYPISDRDVMSFHYGRYYQIPDRRYIFEDRSNLVRARGNPDLEPETTVSYQAAVQHMFTQNLAVQLAVYYKDIFGLLTVEQRQVADEPAPVNVYTNRDYASSRGFELSLIKRYSHHFHGELSYTYGLATGTASDPQEPINTNFLYLPTSEQPLNWDQRHTFSAKLYMNIPGNWQASWIWSYNSGFPYTPTQRDDRFQNPDEVNSGRLPSTSSLDLQAGKDFKAWGQSLTLFVQGRNLLNAKNIYTLSPDNWPVGYVDYNDYVIYYTETGQPGGGYIGTEDNDGDGLEDFVPVHDPRVFAEGRYLRMGLGLSF